MAIDKSIFDKHQKSLLKRDYIDLNDLSNVVYVDESIDIKPLTREDYDEMNISTAKTLWGQEKYETSKGIIETSFAAESQSLTSFTNTTVALMDSYNNKKNTNFSFSSSSNSMSMIDDALLRGIGDLGLSMDDPNPPQNQSDTDKGFSFLFNKIADLIDILPSISAIILTTLSAGSEIAGNVVEGIAGVASGIGNVIGGFGKWASSGFKGKYNAGDDLIEGYKVGSSLTSLVTDPLVGIFNSTLTMGQSAISTYSQWLSNTVSLMSDTFTNTYVDGVTETKFGQKMEDSWKIFLANSKKMNVKFNTTDNPISTLGTEPILFGTPPRYTAVSDPRDRAYINTFIKDGNIMSIIPGKPKYNGLSLSSAGNNTGFNPLGFNLKDGLDSFGSGLDKLLKNSRLNQSSGVYNAQQDLIPEEKNAQEYSDIALSYLKRNGISDVFNSNDKRYYTFDPDYEGYYSYLETMLNTIYTRMGLGETPDMKNELFSFFSNNNGRETLLSKFDGKALGFYFEGNPSVSESMSNDTNDPANLKSVADDMSDEFQRINYTSGFGVKSARKAGVASARITKISEAMSGIMRGSTDKTPFSSMSNVAGGLFGKTAGFADKMLGALSYSANTDLNAITESMLSTNGMKTQFPHLWTDSNYSKSISVEFEFISPYGDPLSIFQYCYVPLCSILSLALPKQAEENGYVNPFFLRMDIPGVISSDFAIISNITWVRGGSNNLWTVDKHPRAISVSVTFEDLYNFLAMTKRISYLSANPNYSMFLDSFSGIRSLYSGNSTINSDYWNLLVNRLNSNNSYADVLWNQTEVDKNIKQYLNTTVPEEKQFFTNYYKRDISWMKDRS